MIHYWNFDQTNPIGGAGGVDLNNIPADFSAIGGASIKYAYILNANGGRPRDTATTTAIIDNVSPGDNSINYRAGYGNFANYNNSGIRFRNPSDSMNYLLFIPTTGFTNIVVTYATESSSTGSGSHEQLFSYSLDSGVTFTTANLPVAYDSAGLAWSLAQLNLSAITGVNNNPKFVLRIHQSAPNTGSSGNNRYDNITVEGVPFAPTISAVTSNSPVCSKDSVQLNVVASSPSLVTYSWSGIGTFNSTTTANPFVKQFESGTYTVTVSNSGGSTTGTVTVVNSLPSDINYDGQVNVNDFLIFVNAYGQPCSHCPSDINQDGQVNVNDFLVFVNAYNTSCK